MSVKNNGVKPPAKGLYIIVQTMYFRWSFYKNVLHPLKQPIIRVGLNKEQVEDFLKITRDYYTQSTFSLLCKDGLFVYKGEKLTHEFYE